MELGIFVTGHIAPQILFSPGDQYVACILAVSVSEWISLLNRSVYPSD